MRVDAERILIVLLGAIGDVVRALPLANRLRAGYPNAHLAWAVEPRSAPVLAEHPALDERLVFERSGGAPSFARFLRDVRARRFDLVLDLQRHLKSGIVSWSTRAPVRIGFHRRNAKELNWLWNTHTIEPVAGRGWELEQ
jgi:ADP-heptose:LPS heptosyltransferase